RGLVRALPLLSAGQLARLGRHGASLRRRLNALRHGYVGPVMAGMRTLAALLSVAASAALARGVLAQSEDPNAPTIHVDANGNAFTGGLSFTPDHVTARIGQVVEWTNTDFLVPHTATEDHGLWDLGGTYGQTPANPSGFGPGMSVSRPFEAGTEHYY